MELSVLYFHHVGTAVDFMGAADRLGYNRFWLGEHHSRWQCANPLLLGSLLAATTEGIRVGSGGVCLTYHSPWRIAEDARLIEYMLPDRFDLGVTHGLKLSPEMREALSGERDPAAARPYDEMLSDLHGFLTGRLPPDHPLAGDLHADSGPPLWVLGVGASTARWAALHGTGFCFSLHHGPQQDGAAILAEYRRSFVPSPEFPKPQAFVVASIFCGSTRAEAQALREERSLRATVAAPPAECVAALADIAGRFDVDEVMILDMLPDPLDEAIERHAEIARLAGLTPRTPAATAAPPPQPQPPAGLISPPRGEAPPEPAGRHLPATRHGAGAQSKTDG